MHWLIPANTKFYDVFGAFRQTTTYWPMNTKVFCGDVVYIYLATPYQQIGFACNVINTDLCLSEIMSKIKPFLKDATAPNKKEKPFMQLKKVVTVDITENSPLAFQQLKKHGLKGMLMGPRKLENNQSLLDYIKRNLP